MIIPELEAEVADLKQRLVHVHRARQAAEVEYRMLLGAARHVLIGTPGALNQLQDAVDAAIDAHKGKR